MLILHVGVGKKRRFCKHEREIEKKKTLVAKKKVEKVKESLKGREEL